MKRLIWNYSLFMAAITTVVMECSACGETFCIYCHAAPHDNDKQVHIYRSIPGDYAPAFKKEKDQDCVPFIQYIDGVIVLVCDAEL